MVDIPAQTNDDDRIEEGSKVLIVRIKDGIATVSDLEQLQSRIKQKKSQDIHE